MKIAINNKEHIKKINNKKIKDKEIIYVFDKEPLEELLEIPAHCIHKDYVQDIDINLTDYKIDCIKKANIKDKDWDILPDKKDYKFAIIVPNYNNDHGEYKGKTFLKNCIESILNQTYKNFELIIVDDMSTDTSVNTVIEYEAQDKRVHLIQNSRKRYNGGSRNVGIEYALEMFPFDYFCFLDSDDWWKDEYVLEKINKRLYNHEMMILGSEMIFKDGSGQEQYNKYDIYEDVFFCINKVWCTAWSRVIRKDKIVYFCEDTLMEDRVWSYKQADNISFDKIINLNEIVYCWNRLNVTNSVSIVRNGIWNASAWCHIGHQLQFLENLKHKEMKPKLEERIKECIRKVNAGIYQQY